MRDLRIPIEPVGARPSNVQEWALVKPTLGSTDYVPAKILRRGKRFTFVEHLPGVEWRFTSRGLWDGFDSREAAWAEIDKMRAATREYLLATRTPETQP